MTGGYTSHYTTTDLVGLAYNAYNSQLTIQCHRPRPFRCVCVCATTHAHPLQFKHRHIVCARGCEVPCVCVASVVCLQIPWAVLAKAVERQCWCECGCVLSPGHTDIPNSTRAGCVWPVGPMDKASASGAGDSRFESWVGQCIYIATARQKLPGQQPTPRPGIEPGSSA